MKLKLGFILFLFFKSSLVLAFPESNPVPGGIVLLPVNNNQIADTARYKQKKLAIINRDDKDFLLVGLSLSSKTGQHAVTIRNRQGKIEKISFQVKPKVYKSQHLTIKNKRKVNPYKNDMPRILREKKRKSKAKKVWTQQPVNADFLVPVEGRISSIFGLRRFFNNQARRPHSGLDIAAPQGTPIKAAESGTVIDSGNFFFSGNMVYIDHGQGLISLYAHMYTLNVQPGDTIKKGQIIGTVGETGRVTGPHLHMSVIANETTIDPLLLMPQLAEKASEYFKNN